jgi:hypothetical protein
VSCPAATACTAIGSQAVAEGTRGSAILAAQWNGRRWKLQPVPAPAGGIRPDACGPLRIGQVLCRGGRQQRGAKGAPQPGARDGPSAARLRGLERQHLETGAGALPPGGQL